ncbi:hypothetical protein ACRJ4W_21975 [Streptomyces sp. GLT-R25]
MTASASTAFRRGEAERVMARTFPQEDHDDREQAAREQRRGAGRASIVQG